ncbi:hypothetical protein YC2023_059087 [Brassica napus]
MMDQIEAFSHDRKRWRILYDDENFVEYVRDKEVKVQIKHWFNSGKGYTASRRHHIGYIMVQMSGKGYTASRRHHIAISSAPPHTVVEPKKLQWLD